MKSIQALRERAYALSNAMSKMLAAAGDKAWPKDQQAAYDAMNEQFEEVKNEIETMEAEANGQKPRASGKPSKAGAASSEEDLPALRTADEFHNHYRRRAGNQASLKDQEGIGIADFMRGVANMQTTLAVRNALQEGTDSAGGYTVPNIVMPEILSALVPNSSLLQAGAAISPQEDGAKSFVLPGIQTLPTAAWRSENGAVAESDPVFRALTATPRSLAVMFKISRELLADSAGMHQALLQVIGQAFAKEMDRVGLRGTGTAPEPRGILNTAGIQSVTNGTNGTSLATLRYGNLLTGFQSIMSADAPMPTAAIMSPRTRVGLASLADTLFQPLAAPPLVRDLQLLTSSQIPNNLPVGGSTDCTEIYMGDFSQVRFVLRENLSVQLLQEAYASTGQLAFIAHMRLDVLVPYAAGLAVVTGVRP